ncbi:MAG: hypothetical protein ACK49D_11315 [Flavobacteriia bacterium]|jgi:hypothetical protein|nr:hypothetical protein [Cryomorphaceae bacterium]
MSTVSIPPVVLPKHRNAGIGVAVGCVLLALLILFIFTFEMADPPPREIPMKTSTSLTELEIKDLKIETGGAGGGTPSNDPIHEPTPQTEKILTKKKNDKSTSNTGESNKTNANNHTNTSTTTAESDDPFAEGGEDGGQGGGRGGKIGKDNGKYEGKGNSDPAKRIRLNDPNVENIEVPRFTRVNLQMTIDEDGKILSARSTSKTTTTDQRIINRVISEVKKQVRFNKDPDTSPVTVYLTVEIPPK